MPFEKECIVNINGEVLSPENASINIFDRGFLFGDSIYEATLCKGSVPLFFDEHYERFLNTARIVNGPMPFSKNHILNEFQRILKQRVYEQGMIRIVITRGIDYLSIIPSEETTPNLILIYKELPPYPRTWYEKGLSIKIASIKRNHPKTTNPEAKTGNYLNSVLAAIEAKKAGYDDAVFLNIDNFITEGTTNNFWIVKDKTVYTPSLSSGILSGITRMKIIELCQKNNIEVIEGLIKLSDVEQASESFITSSTKGIVPVTSIDKKPVGNGQVGQVTKTLNKLYTQLVETHIKEQI